MSAAVSSPSPRAASQSPFDPQKAASIQLRENLKAATSAERIFQLWQAQSSLFNSYHLNIAFERLSQLPYDRKAQTNAAAIHNICAAFVGTLTKKDCKQSHTVFIIRNLAKKDLCYSGWFPKFQTLFSERRKEMPLATLLAVTEVCAQNSLGSSHLLRELTEEVMSKRAELTTALAAQFITNVTSHSKYKSADKAVQIAVATLRAAFAASPALTKKSPKSKQEPQARRSPDKKDAKEQAPSPSETAAATGGAAATATAQSPLLAPAPAPMTVVVHLEALEDCAAEQPAPPVAAHEDPPVDAITQLLQALNAGTFGGSVYNYTYV